jgi:acylphosphatase
MDDKGNGPEPGTLARVHVIVEGRVQGVGFRYFVKENALAWGLTGWVRNRWDDTVEVMAEGVREDVDQLLDALRKGPRAAVVDNLKIDWGDYLGEFGGFYIQPTF